MLPDSCLRFAQGDGSEFVSVKLDHMTRQVKLSTPGLLGFMFESRVTLLASSEESHMLALSLARL